MLPLPFWFVDFRHWILGCWWSQLSCCYLGRSKRSQPWMASAPFWHLCHRARNLTIRCGQLFIPGNWLHQTFTRLIRGPCPHSPYYPYFRRVSLFKYFHSPYWLIGPLCYPSVIPTCHNPLPSSRHVLVIQFTQTRRFLSNDCWLTLAVSSSVSNFTKNSSRDGSFYFAFFQSWNQNLPSCSTTRVIMLFLWSAQHFARRLCSFTLPLIIALYNPKADKRRTLYLLQIRTLGLLQLVTEHFGPLWKLPHEIFVFPVSFSFGLVRDPH